MITTVVAMDLAMAAVEDTIPETGCPVEIFTMDTTVTMATDTMEVEDVACMAESGTKTMTSLTPSPTVEDMEVTCTTAGMVVDTEGVVMARGRSWLLEQ